jgi:hypothetical protein
MSGIDERQTLGKLTAEAASCVSDSSETQKKIRQITESICRLLIEKNRRYGDAALCPKNIFSGLSAGEAIKVRLDDKLGRIMANEGPPRKNDFSDLIGYLVLFCVSQGWTDFSDLLD